MAILAARPITITTTKDEGQEITGILCRFSNNRIRFKDQRQIQGRQLLTKWVPYKQTQLSNQSFRSMQIWLMRQNPSASNKLIIKIHSSSSRTSITRNMPIWWRILLRKSLTLCYRVESSLMEIWKAGLKVARLIFLTQRTLQRWWFRIVIIVATIF